MPRLRDPLILQAELETFRVQVEALRVGLSDLAYATEVLLREANPMTAASQQVQRLIRRAENVLTTFASEQTRVRYEELEADRALLDFLELEGEVLRRVNNDWKLSTARQPPYVVQWSGRLREGLTKALKAVARGSG
jgi:hypothetical protein